MNDGEFNGGLEEVLEEGPEIQREVLTGSPCGKFLRLPKALQREIYLVFGEFDKFIKQELSDGVVKILTEIGDPTMILKG